MLEQFPDDLEMETLLLLARKRVHPAFSYTSEETEILYSITSATYSLHLD